MGARLGDGAEGGQGRQHREPVGEKGRKNGQKVYSNLCLITRWLQSSTIAFLINKFYKLALCCSDPKCTNFCPMMGQLLSLSHLVQRFLNLVLKYPYPACFIRVSVPAQSPDVLDLLVYTNKAKNKRWSSIVSESSFIHWLCRHTAILMLKKWRSLYCYMVLIKVKSKIETVVCLCCCCKRLTPHSPFHGLRIYLKGFQNCVWTLCVCQNVPETVAMYFCGPIEKQRISSSHWDLQPLVYTQFFTLKANT